MTFTVSVARKANDQIYRESGYTFDTKYKVLDALSKTVGAAALIIACVGAAGAWPGAALGWTVVGLGAAGFILHLAHGNIRERVWTRLNLLTLIPLAGMITLGALGGAGVLSAVQVGQGLLGLAGSFVAGLCLQISCCKTPLEKKAYNQASNDYLAEMRNQGKSEAEIKEAAESLRAFGYLN